MNHSIKLMRSTSLLALAVASLAVGGCSEYSVRSEYMSDDFGRALASNTAMQTVHLSRRSAQNTNIRTDGTAASNAIDAYRTPVSTSEGESQVNVAPVLIPTTN